MDLNAQRTIDDVTEVSALDLTGAAITEHASHNPDGRMQPAPSIELPNQDAEYVSHIALDIGGSLIKLVYFSPDTQGLDASSPTPAAGPGTSRGGRLHFVKFESSRVEDVIAFIEAKGLHRFKGRNGAKDMRIKATGGGAYKYADVFKEKLGVVLEKEDEMACLVAGCNFLLKAITHEAFIFENGAPTFVPTNEEGDLYPYLLVNIGSGVSMVKVSGEGQYERVSGSSLGGGTFWGLCHLLTQRKDFDEMLELSMKGDNANVDMLVGDIYGGRDYSNIGLSASTIASSFGKVISQDKPLSDYAPADMAMALCRMVSYNIGQLAYLNAMRYNIKRIFFGGFFIRGHPYTMETISYAIKFWSKGEMAAMFLRHEGFLGSVGAFLTVHPMTPPGRATAGASQPRKVRARFVERFSMGAPWCGQVVGPAIGGLNEKVSWVEKFVALGGLQRPGQETEVEAGSSGKDAAVEGNQPQDGSSSSTATTHTPHSVGVGPGSMSEVLVQRTTTSDQPLSPAVRMALHVGVLHYSPSSDVFPLLADPSTYEPNTLDVARDEEEWRWWLNVLESQIPTVVDKASASAGGSDDAKRRAAAFGRAFAAHMSKLRAEPGAYGALGVAELFEMREECLREFGFEDVYRMDKERESAAALAVLPDLLAELDSLEGGPGARWLALVEGALAANIFDWGAASCVALYRAGTILDIYREARARLSRRPWALDTFDDFVARITGPTTDAQGVHHPPNKLRRVLMFVDNHGADIVLGMLPIARELLRTGSEVVLVANKLPAINDVTVSELRHLVAAAGQYCPIIKAAREQGQQVEVLTGGRVPPYPGACIHPTRSSSTLSLTALVSNGSSPLYGLGSLAASAQGESRGSGRVRRVSSGSSSQGSGRGSDELLAARDSPNANGKGSRASGTTWPPGVLSVPGPKLYIISNGQGSPCLDLRRIPDVLAEACAGTDLIIIEGMGRAIHTNYNATFKCDSLKLAMIKTERLAKTIFGEHGALYDCVCKFTPGTTANGAGQDHT